MITSLIITVLADDRPGIVKELSAVLRSHQANWTDSRMAQLAGKFAGLLHVEVATDQVEALTSALKELKSSGLQIQVEQSDIEAPGDGAKLLQLEVLGQDRPGIIEDITRKLAALNVNIIELSSAQQLAQMSNELLFHADLSLSLPADMEPEDVQQALEEMSDQLMVDLNFS